MLNKLRGVSLLFMKIGREQEKYVRTFVRNTTKEGIPSKDLLWNKNVSIDEKIKCYNFFKTNRGGDDDVAEMIEVCSLTANCCFMMKREKEFKECLVDLKSYCSKLNDFTETKVNENLWNFIIQHFCKEESFHSYAIYLFKRIMKEKKLSKPNLFTLTGILKVCAKGHVNINYCEEIVNELERANAMNVFLYGHFINNCISNNNLEKALEILLDIRGKGIEPNYAIYIPILKSATIEKNTQAGMRVCNLLKKSNLASPQLSMTIISFGLKVKQPELVIEQIEIVKQHKWMTSITWNCLIQAHVQMKNVKAAIGCMHEMKSNNISPDSGTFTILLTACANSNLFEEGKLIHEMAVKTLNHDSVEVLTSTVNFYTKCGYPEIAIEECIKMKSKGIMNVISWNCFIQAYIQNGEIQKAIELIDEMKYYNITPSSSTFTDLMKACTQANLFEEGKFVHKQAIHPAHSLESVELLISIVNFYTKCGHPEIAIGECQKLKSKGLMNNIAIWNCLIQAHIQNNNIQQAIRTVQEMKHDNVNPDSVTFTILIATCADLRLYEEGNYIYEVSANLDSPTIELNNSLINFYTKCGHPEIAIEIFEKLKLKGIANVVTWTCLIQAYIEMNETQKAIQALSEMKQYGVKPNSRTFAILLSACANLNLFEEGKLVHEEAIQNLKDLSHQLLTAIVNFYTKCGHPQIAIEECEKMKSKGLMNNVSLWNCLIQAHIEMNDTQQAIQTLQEMKHDNVNPDSVTFTILLRACSAAGLYEEGLIIQKLIPDAYLDSVELITTISNFYTKCGHSEIAIEIFEKMKLKGMTNIVSWTCLIQMYIEMNDIKKAMQAMLDVKERGVPLDSTIFIVLLTACANLKLFEEGKFIHKEAIQHLKNLPSKLLTTVVNFYTKCGFPEIAIKECEKLKSKGLMNSVVSWTCLIQAYIEMNDIKKAIQVLFEMKESGTPPDATTLTILLTACANSNLFEEGKFIHKYAIQNLKDLPFQLLTAIVHFYTKCGHPEIAIEEFEKMNSKELQNVSIWNCLIQAHIERKDIQQAIQLLSEMRNYGVNPDSTTFTILLSACANLNLFEEGKLVHEEAIQNLKDLSHQLLTAIVNFYTKCGHPQIAINECEKMKSKGLMNNVSIWNCLIQAHIQLSLSTHTPYITEFGQSKTMSVFEEMKKSNINPDRITYVLLLSACGEYVARKNGMEIIDEIKQKGMDAYEEIVSAMIYYYSRIGNNSIAQELFDNLSKKSSEGYLSIITYNNMLSCYAQHGKGVEALKLFNEMVEKNVVMNEQTFTIMLNTFSHCGMVEEAIDLYDEMKTKYKYNPSIIVDCVMVDVFSRAGRFNEAEKVINERKEFVLWNALMAGCRKFNNLELAERVFKVLTDINEKEPGPYILLSNILTYHGLNERAEHIRQLMAEREIKKVPGIVYQEEDGKLYQFVSGSKDYGRYEEVERMREEIYRKIIKAGFEPDTKWVTNSKLLTEEERLDSLSRHAEKTAIAHAFVLNPNRKSITLTKNLRVCNDCHTATEFISKEMNVEIIVRDSNRYHHFKDGKCSCGGFW